MLFRSPGTTTAADSFTVAGDANRSYSIATTGGNVTSGATSLAFTTTPSAATAALSATGAGSFTVGGTLTVTATAARPTPTVVVARLTLSATGSAKRSPVVPLDLVLGCSAVVAASRHTRPTLGTDASARGSASQLGWGRRRLGVAQG